MDEDELAASRKMNREKTAKYWNSMPFNVCAKTKTLKGLDYQEHKIFHLKYSAIKATGLR